MHLKNTLLALCIAISFNGAFYAQENEQLTKLLEELRSTKLEKAKTDLFEEIAFEYESIDLDKSFIQKF